LNSGEDAGRCEVDVLRKVGLGLLAALLGTMILLNGLAWSGALVDEDGATPVQTVPAEPVVAPQSAPAAENPRPRAARPIARRKPVRKPAPKGPTLVLTATRGDCWVEVRAGTATGATLFAGTLSTGRSLRFSRPKIWLRLGAASNVDIVVNGRPSSVPPGTVELTVPDA
jgi:Domain of unknown function (DUF4115)